MPSNSFERKEANLVRIVQVGLGPLGRRVVQAAVERGSLKIVGAVDPAPDTAGEELGTLCGLGRIGVKVGGDLWSALRGRKADVAILTTVSDMRRIRPQVEEIARAAGVPPPASPTAVPSTAKIPPPTMPPIPIAAAPRTPMDSLPDSLPDCFELVSVTWRRS